LTSIRQRLFLQVGIVITTMLLLLWFANAFLLENYYINQQKKVLLENYASLNALSVEELSSSIDSYKRVESASNVDIIITDDGSNLVYSSTNLYGNEMILNRIMANLENKDTVPLPRMGMDFNKKTDQMMPPPQNTRSSRAFPNEEIINDLVSYSTGKDPISNEESIALVGTLDNGYTINLRVPLTSIKASIDVVNSFLLIIGCVVMVLGFVLTYIFSSFFTKPIKEISRVTGHMKNLDFGEACEVTSKDELGALATNVNDMSLVLSSTISNLNHTNKELGIEVDARKKLDDKRRQLLSNVSHELKTPLSLMEGYAEALKLGLHTDPERIDFYCDVIIDETEKMNRLVQSLLNIDQMEFGDTKSQPLELDLTDYLKGALMKYEPKMKEASIQLSTELPETLIVVADPLHLEQVFINYLTNAIHYCDDQKKLRIAVDIDGDKAIVKVHNSAKKLSSEDLDKIWDSFYKIDKARTRDKGGHGLGLSIVKAIQEANALGYGVANDGDGVTFWFECNLQQVRHSDEHGPQDL